MMLGFPYGAILVFSAFGPVLNRVVGLQRGSVMSTFFLIVLAIAMLIPPGRPLAVERCRGYLPALTGVGAAAASVFPFVPHVGQWISLMVLAFTLGRIAVFWSRTFLGTVPKHYRGRVIAKSLFVAYGLLYLFNVATPSLPPWVLTPLVGVLVLLTIPFFRRLPREKTFLLDWRVRPEYPVPLRRRTPFASLAVVFLVYTVAGFTFAGMFPVLAQTPIDRFYNVLAFVLIVPLAGLIADRAGRLVLLYAGVAAIGLALVFFQMPAGLQRYVGAQTAVQIGWAFLDVYVWVWAADLVFDYKNAQLQNLGVATFLAGTAVGALVTLLFWQALITDHRYYLLTMPLFAAVALMSRVVQDRAVPPPDADMDRQDRLPASLSVLLTERENEIALLLISGRKNREICEDLHVSPNTLKTHCRHIYHKLDVQNRLELRELARLSPPEVPRSLQPG